MEVMCLRTCERK